jgi:hypothetical protein
MTSCTTPSSAGFIVDRCEHPFQFVRFIEKISQAIFINNPCFDQQLQPINCFRCLFKAIADLGRKFGLRSGTISFRIVRPYRSSRPQDLPAYHVSLAILGQGSSHTHNPQGKGLSPILQVKFSILTHNATTIKITGSKTTPLILSTPLLARHSDLPPNLGHCHRPWSLVIGIWSLPQALVISHWDMLAHAILGHWSLGFGH